MKKISQRNLYYSLVLAAVMMLFLIGYFAWMLPSLYVDYIEEQNVEAVKEQHNAFMEHGSYDGIQVKNPSACASVKIPFSGPDIEVATKLVSMKITAVEHETQALLTELQKFIKSLQSEGLGSTKADSKEADSGAGKMELRFADSRFYKQINKWKNKLSDISAEYVKLPVKIEFIQPDHKSKLYNSELFKVHSLSDRKAVLEASVENYENKYTNYLVIEYTVDGIVCSILPVVTPEMEEIRPVVMQSLPMLGAVILVITLIFSQVYSGGIVQPVYQKLEDMNQVLLEENKRQEVFMRASSHQLKTPITCISLIVQMAKEFMGETRATEIERQLNRLTHLEESLLLLSRIDAGTLTFDRKPTDVFTILSLASDNLYELFLQNGVLIDIPEMGEMNINVDLNWTMEAVMNLMKNCMEATETGTAVHCSYEKNPLYVQMRIWDEGEGFTKEDLTHLFERFYRGEKTKNTGIGIGLSLSKAIIEMQNGIIRAFNLPKGGACFEIRFYTSY